MRRQDLNLQRPSCGAQNFFVPWCGTEILTAAPSSPRFIVRRTRFGDDAPGYTHRLQAYSFVITKKILRYPNGFRRIFWHVAPKKISCTFYTITGFQANGIKSFISTLIISLSSLFKITLMSGQYSTSI